MHHLMDLGKLAPRHFYYSSCTRHPSRMALKRGTRSLQPANRQSELGRVKLAQHGTAGPQLAAAANQAQSQASLGLGRTILRQD
jgi:hypothetical protein